MFVVVFRLGGVCVATTHEMETREEAQRVVEVVTRFWSAEVAIEENPVLGWCDKYDDEDHFSFPKYDGPNLA